MKLFWVPFSTSSTHLNGDHIVLNYTKSLHHFLTFTTNIQAMTWSTIVRGMQLENVRCKQLHDLGFVFAFDVEKSCIIIFFQLLFDCGSSMYHKESYSLLTQTCIFIKTHPWLFPLVRNVNCGPRLEGWQYQCASGPGQGWWPFVSQIQQL